MKHILIICLLFTFVACLSHRLDNSKIMVPAGSYKLDKSHASLIFRVNHLGISNYTARFKRFDAQLQFDPKNPTSSSIIAKIDPTSIETDFPDKKVNFNAMLQKAQWLDVAKFPQITFASKEIIITGKNKARITGELSLHGIKHPVILDAIFNGGYEKHDFDPSGSRIGFSAHGSLKRSDFGITFGIPEAGSKMGVGDEVEFFLEVEFTKPLVK